MFEVVTAVAWEEWEGIVMVTMVLVGAWVWDTEPKEKNQTNKHQRSFYEVLSHQCIYIQIKRGKKNPTQTTSQKNSAISLLKSACALPNAAFTINEEFFKGNQVPSSRRKTNKKTQQKTHPTTLPHEYSPAVVAEAIVFVAKIGATVAAATGVPVLKMVF